MTTRHLLLAGLIVTTAALCGAAQAATLSTTLQGTGLSVDSPCARSVRITPDAGLHGQVVIETTAEHPEEIDHLLLESGRTARVHTHPGSCFQATPSTAPTLTLSVRVPPGVAVRIEESGVGQYTVGQVGGTLTLDLSGAAEISDEAVTALQATISGAGAVRITRADGPGHVDISGHAQVEVAQASMPLLTLDLSGAGRLHVASGHIGKAKLTSSGAGSIDFGADVDAAQVDLSGMGSVRFAKAPGQIEKDVSGLGSVVVGQ